MFVRMCFCVCVCVGVWEGAHEDKTKNISEEISLTFENVIFHHK